MRLKEIQSTNKIEAYGYVYNNRDQRIIWRKIFSSVEAANAWADKRNATILGTKELKNIENDKILENVSSLPSVDVAKKNINKILQVAQRQYDIWDETDIDTYAGGGICHLIADAICDVLWKLNIECTTLSCSYEQHVYVVAKFDEGIYQIDIPYHIYETGGGYNWKKLPNIVFSPNDVVFYKITSDIDEWENYIEESITNFKTIDLHENIVSNSITLKDLYNSNYPAKDEIFWDYVRLSDLTKPLTIKILPKHTLKIMLQSQYRVEHIDELFDMMDNEQIRTIKKYIKDPNLANKMIVVCKDRIIDGNHRAFAAAKKGTSINYIDLVDLDEEELQESASGYIPSYAEKDDPRFKTGLTVDIKPDTLMKNAKKLGSTISRAGVPPVIKFKNKR